MSYFTIIYRFLCMNCKHINAGKRVIEAESAELASHSLANIELPCPVCHQTVRIEAEAHTWVVPASDQELSEAGLGPAVPRT